MKINTCGKGAHIEETVKEGFRNPKGLVKRQKTETSCGVNITSKRQIPNL
jgi:hypothetical protein